MKKRFRIISLAIVLAMVLTLIPIISVFAAETLSTNVTVPFSSSVQFEAGGSTVTSNSFRIPAMVTLDDGTILAAADIRWNTTYDGGGLDTLTARSADGGVTWEYTTANYLGDNGNVYNGSGSTCFIDPCLTVAADGQTVYMLVDIYPYGIALNGSGNTQPSTEVGFTDDGYLKLSNDGNSSYGYYLKDGKIYSTAGTEVSGYTVDEYFNLYQNGTQTSNLFYSDSPYKVARTGFLYLTKSTDGGATWSAPTLLDLKTSSEQVCLVGPGRGLTTSDGTMIFPVYKFNGDASNQRMGFIYSTDGVNWARVNSNISWSSEAAVVEIGTGTLRFFYRNGNSTLRYVDYNMNTGSWGSEVNTGIATNSNTQISAITYSRTSDGKQVVLVSCPMGPTTSGSNQSGASYRQNGRIFVFTVEESGALTREKTIEVNNGSFMYSCLTERSDGSIAILFEDHQNAWGTGTNCYYTMDMKAYSASALGITLDESTTPEPEEPTDPETPEEPIADETITMELGATANRIVSATAVVGTAGTFTTADSAVEYTVAHTSQEGAITATKKTSLSDGDKVVISDGTNYLTLNGTTLGSTTDPAQAAEWTVGVSSSWYSTEYTLSSGNYYLCPRSGVNTYSLNVSTSSWYNTWDYSSDTGFYYSNRYLYNNGSWDVARNISSGYGAAYTLTQTEEIKKTEVSFKALDVTDGTYITVGDLVYKIIVNPKNAAISEFLLTGSSMTLDPIADLGLSGSGYTVSYEETADADGVISLSGAAVTAGTLTGTATVTATVTSANGNTVGTAVYTITVGDVEITDTKNIYVPVNGTATIEGLTGEIYADMLDTAIATVVPAEGTLTDENIVITGVTEGKTSVIVGTVQFNIFVNPENTGHGADTSKYVYIYIDAIEHCSVYYAINGGELHKIEGTGVLIDQTYTDGFNIMFFSAPVEGYALTSMSATNTNDQYYSMAGGTAADATDTDAWPLNDANATTIPTGSGDSAWKSGHGFRWCLLQGNMTLEEMRDLFTRAKALGADGATTFTKNDPGTDTNDGNGNNVSTNLSFIAEQLPTMTKSITGYVRDGASHAYTEDTWLQFGDIVTYQFTITTYSTNIAYTGITLTDANIGYSQTIADNTLDTAGQTLTYNAQYTINEADADKYATGAFRNEAELDFTLKSRYSSGASFAKANAEVSCWIAGLVYYVWQDGLPAGITEDAVTYPLPGYKIVEFGGTDTVEAYTGATEYTETDANGNITGTWRFLGWEYNGTMMEAGTTFEMPYNNHVGLIGTWEYTPAEKYSVTYQWTNAPAEAVLPVNTDTYYSGETFTVDGTYINGTEIEVDGVRWTFGGWKLNGAVVTGEQTVGTQNITLIGTWMTEQMVTSMTITKTGSSLSDPGQTFIFRVTGTDGTDLRVMTEGNGSVTITGISVGQTYTVTEETEWSWRYLPDQTAYELAASADAAENTVTVKNSRSMIYWLDGNALAENIFSAIGS